LRITTKSPYTGRDCFGENAQAYQYKPSSVDEYVNEKLNSSA
jgi:hypothetical protein